MPLKSRCGCYLWHKGSVLTAIACKCKCSHDHAGQKSRKLCSGRVGNRDKDIRRRLLRRSVLDGLELRKFLGIVMNKATVDVHGVHINIPYIWVIIFISAWALALSVQLFQAMRRPQFVGQTTTGSHVFFYDL